MPNPYDGPEYRRLLERARRSLERTGGDLSGSVSLAQPGDAERKAIIGLTGQYRDTRTSRIVVRLADLDAAVREATGHGLRELLAEQGGPLRDRPAERSALAGVRAAALRGAEASSLHASLRLVPGLAGRDRAGRQPDQADQGGRAGAVRAGGSRAGIPRLEVGQPGPAARAGRGRHRGHQDAQPRNGAVHAGAAGPGHQDRGRQARDGRGAPGPLGGERCRG